MKRFAALLLSLVMVLGLGTQASAAAPLDGYPTVDELEASDTIPNPFEFFDVKNDPNGDGVVSDVAEWQARRDEIKDLVQHYWLGYRWPTVSEDVSGGIVDVEEPNTVSYGGFWGMGATTFNLGEAFLQLKGALLAGPVTVGETTFEQAADEEEAQELAIAAWNAGWGLPYTNFGQEATAVFVESTGPIDANSIPQATKIVARNVVRIRNGEVERQFYLQISVPSPEQKQAAWGDSNAEVPFVIGIGSVFNTDSLLAQGYGHVVFTPTDIYADSSGANPSRAGIYTDLYPYNANEYEYASGALMAWGWGASQIITALENPAIGDADGKTFGEVLGLDPTRTVVTGHSRYGKAAMFAAAFDERISICVPSEPGGSGIQSYRYKVEGKIFNFNTQDYPKADRVYGKTETPTVSYGSGSSWFPETAAQLVDHDDKFPFDASDIIALVAPRPFFVVSGIDTHWLGNEGGVASVMAAAEVYNFIGKDAVEKNNIAVRCRQSDHMFYNQDFCFALAIMDREFGKANSADGLLHVQDLFPDGENYASMSYPAANYNTVSEMTSHPFEISSYYMPWSSPNKYILWTAQDSFLTDHDVTITAHSDAPDVDLITPDGATIDAVSSADGVFTFQVTAEQAVYGRYTLTTVGSQKENRSVHFSAVSLADALRHGTTKGDEGEENRVLGFSSRLANNAEDPPVVYIDGVPTTMSFSAARMKPEETTLLSYGILFHDPLFVRIANEGWDETKTFSVKNLKFVTMPEYTFEFSMADIYASAENAGKEGANLFTKPISWPVERYNNGEASVWPLIPNNKAEREILNAGGTITRPEAPEPHTTAFDATVVSQEIIRTDAGTTLKVRFSEPLNTGEYAFGFDAADDWTTSWNETGDELTVDIPGATGRTIHMIIFRLMDLEDNLIAGPMELTFEAEAEEFAVDLPEIFAGETTALEGETYTFRPQDDANYDYETPAVTMGGVPVEAVANEDGSWSVSAVSGDLVITGSRTAKTYPVRFVYDGDAALVLPEDGTAAYGTDYSFELPAAEGVTVSAAVTIGGENYEPAREGTRVTIAGADIKGEIVVTFATAAAAEYVVSFETNGGSDVAAVTVPAGGLLARPEDPKRDGFAFAGWFLDKELKTEWDFDHDTVSGDMTLYAKWTSTEKPGGTTPGTGDTASLWWAIPAGVALVVLMGCLAVVIRKKRIR